MPANSRIHRWTPKIVVNNALYKQEVAAGRAAHLVASDIRKSINRPNLTGKSPSRPGEPPKRVSGNLREHVQVVVRRFTYMVQAAVSVAVPYAKMLEFGTSRMQPRPFIRPAWVRNRDRIKQLLGGTGKVKR